MIVYADCAQDVQCSTSHVFVVSRCLLSVIHAHSYWWGDDSAVDRRCSGRLYTSAGGHDGARCGALSVCRTRCAGTGRHCGTQDGCLRRRVAAGVRSSQRGDRVRAQRIPRHRRALERDVGPCLVCFRLDRACHHCRCASPSSRTASTHRVVTIGPNSASPCGADAHSVVIKPVASL